MRMSVTCARRGPRSLRGCASLHLPLLPLGLVLLTVWLAACADGGEDLPGVASQGTDVRGSPLEQGLSPVRTEATVPFWDGDCSAPPPAGYEITFYEAPYEGCYLSRISTGCGAIQIGDREYCAPGGALYSTSCGSGGVDFDCPASLRFGDSVVSWRNVPGEPAVLKVWNVLPSDEAALADLRRAFFVDQKPGPDAVIRSDGISACDYEGAIVECPPAAE